MGVASGTAWAGPDSGIPDIGYQTTLVGKTVVTTLQHGTFADGERMRLQRRGAANRTLRRDASNQAADAVLALLKDR